MAMIPNLPPEDDLGEPESDLNLYAHLEHLTGEEDRLQDAGEIKDRS